ncbi:hypothetical protein IMY05_C4635000100 [Salix suchowensis]|nr:hypothetical protein IMY05_C4635000100 [Salix suchowensis]
MDGSSSKLCLMPTEDKVSTGLGLGLLIDFDSAQEGDVPNMTTMHAMKQVYTQVALADGSLGLLTGLRNGTWVYGHKDEPRRAPFDIIARSWVKHPLPWHSCIENVMLFMWMMVSRSHKFKILNVEPYPASQLSVLCLRIAGPSLLRTRWINLHLWTSDHSVHRLHAEHTTNSWPELGQGAHGIVKAIHGMNLVIKIGSEDVISAKLLSIYEPAPIAICPWLQTLGHSTSMVQTGALLDPYEISEALEVLATQLHIHHHDISLANIVRGVTDKKLKIIDFAEAVDAEDCDNSCNHDYIEVGLNAAQQGVSINIISRSLSSETCDENGNAPKLGIKSVEHGRPPCTLADSG